jgi:hypothetical protein
MRHCAMALLVLAGCSSSEVTTTVTSSSGSAAKPATSSAKSAAAPASASAAAPATSGTAAPAMRDAEAELKALDPFNDSAPDGAQKLLTAMTLCGEPTSSTAPWGREDSVAEDKAAPALAKPPAASRCSPESHAKLYMLSASMLADSKTPENKKTAEEHAYFALALDPKAALPAGANAAAIATVAAAKKRPAPEARVGAVTTSDEATPKELEKAAAVELGSGIRLCYASGLLLNPNLQGNLAVQAEVAADGRLSEVKVSGSLPDAGVISCVARFGNRSKVNAPSRTPTRVSIPFVLSPGGK